MTEKQVRSAYKDLRKLGMTDQEIADALYSMYKSDKIDYDQLDALLTLLGYKLNDDFMKSEMNKFEN